MSNSEEIVTRDMILGSEVLSRLENEQIRLMADDKELRGRIKNLLGHISTFKG